MEKSYRALISRTEEEFINDEVDLRVEEAHQQLQLDRSATKRELLKAKKRLAEAESDYPFQTEAVVNAELKVEGLEKGLKKIEAIEARLFPKENQ